MLLNINVESRDHVLTSSLLHSQLFLDCIAFVQAHDLWHLYSARITLIQGMFSHALEQWDEAYKCYSIAAALTADPHMRHLNILARASILFIRFAQGRTVNFSNTSGSRSIKLDKGATPTKRTSEQEELTRLARDIISDCQQDGTVPLLKMLGNIVLAMVNGEVARGRALLGLAIAQADNTNNLHFKPLILALLSSYFLHMRNDQAQKMLHSARKYSESTFLPLALADKRRLPRYRLPHSRRT